MAEAAPIREQFTVPLAPEPAFDLFLNDLGSWWPAEYTWSGEALQTIGIEPREGGMCFELGPHGFRCDWGRVQDLHRPRALVFSWQIGPGREPVPDPEQASEVEVGFEPEEALDRTRVTFEHRGFERHGEAGAGYREALASEQGWPYILGRFAAAAGG